MLGRRVDAALVAVAAGRYRPVLELARDEPGALATMATQFGMPVGAVAHDLASFHAVAFEARHEALTSAYDALLAGAAALGPGDRVLDVGCGSGATTRAAARAAAPGPVVGVDVAGAPVSRAAARARTEGLGNASFLRADAGSHAFEPASFDVVVSRHGTMYLPHLAPGFANLARALRPGGRLAMLTWRDLDDNPWLTLLRDVLGRDVPDRPAHDPGAFALADRTVIERVLAGAGFVDVDVQAVDEPVLLGADGDDAYDFVTTFGSVVAVLGGLDREGRGRVLGDLRAALAGHATPGGVLAGSGSWLTTAAVPGPRSPSAPS